MNAAPKFSTYREYEEWRAEWRQQYMRLAGRIRSNKKKSGRRYQLLRNADAKIANNLMLQLQEAKDRWQRIKAMRAQLADQSTMLPIVLDGCRTIDFHYNTGSTLYPDLPTWVIKAKGKTFYINNMTSNLPWMTRETPNASTRGMIRFRDCDLSIDKNGQATILETTSTKMAA